MPAYNAERYIRESINSVIVQTYENWELIIIDDGSSDTTADIVKKIAATDDRIRYYFQENGKQGKARNLGIENSNGSYLAFLDADDLWNPEKLKIQTDFLANHPETDLVFSQGYALQEKVATDFNVLVKNEWSQNDIGLFISGNQIPILSVLVKKEAILTVNGFEENPTIQNVEDYHLWLKLLLSGKRFASIDARLFYYRIHTLQSTFSNENIAVPTIKMFELLRTTSNLSKWGHQIIQRIKWGIFNKDTASLVFVIVLELSKKINTPIHKILGLLQNLPNTKLKYKLAFKLASFL
ncbi:glycosyltransferase family 2 protein [Hufsiella arboris]|nr:glycosyltransferase family A protein [Hufsiella arboris]